MKPTFLPPIARLLLLAILAALLSASAFAHHQENNDYDNDTIPNSQDNCPYTPNAGLAGELTEGQSAQFTVEGTIQIITLDFVDADEAKFTVNNEATPKLREGEGYFLSGPGKIIVQEIFYQDYGSGIHGASFLIGAQKDSDRNGIGDACPNYDNEEERLDDLQEQFDVLKEEYYSLNDFHGLNTVEKQQIEALADTVNKFNRAIQELQQDVEENDALDNRHALRDTLDELEEDGQWLQEKVMKLSATLSQQEQQYLPTLTYQPPATVELPAYVDPAPPTPKVTVLKWNWPVQEQPAAPEPANENRAIVWLIAGIAVVLVMLLFLLLAAVRDKN